MERPIPLISYRRAIPLLLAWAESLGDTLDVCPLPTANTWVYVSGAAGNPFKVGFTKFPATRPFTSWRDCRLIPSTYPLVMISEAGRNVERLIKRAAFPWSLCQTRPIWNRMHNREVFECSSPMSDIVVALQREAEACFYESAWQHTSPILIENEIISIKRRAA